MDRRTACRFLSAFVLALPLGAATAQTQSGTIKIAYIDPLSGMMAATGYHGLR